MIALALLLADAQTSTALPSAMVMGAGNVTCGKWTATFKNPNGVDELMYQSWVAGYLTAADAFTAKVGKPSLFDGLDADALNGWISNYCAAHPLDRISSAATNLAAEMNRRRS